MFPGYLISLRGGNLNEPARSPDLNFSDFLLWGYLNFELFLHRLKTLEERISAIREETVAIHSDLFERVMQTLPICLNECLRKQIHHLNVTISKIQKPSTVENVGMKLFLRNYDFLSVLYLHFPIV